MHALTLLQLKQLWLCLKLYHYAVFHKQSLAKPLMYLMQEYTENVNFGAILYLLCNLFIYTLLPICACSAVLLYLLTSIPQLTQPCQYSTYNELNIQQLNY